VPASLAQPINPALRDPAWTGRLFWSIAILVLLLPAFVATEFKPWILLESENLKVSSRFLGDFFPPETKPDFLLLVLKEAWRTIAIATAGTFLALLLAIPMTLISTRVLSISSLSGRMHHLPFVVRQLMRWVLIIIRSVPELIWALVFVRVVGLGPAAGVLAIGLTYAGMLGKVYTEILESGDHQFSSNLMRNGSSRLQAFFYGVLPQNLTELTSYTVYRWECAIRASAVLGFVGAGGLGQQLDNSMRMFNGGEVATILIVFMLLVGLADLLSAWLRKILR
jgi:phosphonate transport system permease protein